MNSSNPSGNGAAVQGGSASNNNSATSKMKPILRCVSFCRVKNECVRPFIFWFVLVKSNMFCLHCVLQLIRAVRCVAGSSFDSQAANLRSGSCTEGSRRGAGERTAPGFFLTQGEGQAETEKVSGKRIFFRYWNN